jgi:hypothetical protein
MILLAGTVSNKGRFDEKMVGVVAAVPSACQAPSYWSNAWSNGTADTRLMFEVGTGVIQHDVDLFSISKTAE